MKSGRSKIDIFQKMRIKILRGVSDVRFKKTRLLHYGNVETHLIRSFLRNGRLRLKIKYDEILVLEHFYAIINFVPIEINIIYM